MAKKVAEPIHPGEILLEDFLKPMGVSQYRLAKGNQRPTEAYQRDRASQARYQC